MAALKRLKFGSWELQELISSRFWIACRWWAMDARKHQIRAVGVNKLNLSTRHLRHPFALKQCGFISNRKLETAFGQVLGRIRIPSTRPLVLISPISCDASLGPWGTALTVSTWHLNIGTALEVHNEAKMDRVVPIPLVDGKTWCMLQRDRHNCNSPNLPTSEDCNTNLGAFAIIGKHGKTYEFTMIWVNLSDVTRPPPFKVAFTIVGGMLLQRLQMMMQVRLPCYSITFDYLLHSSTFYSPGWYTVFITYHTR